MIIPIVAFLCLHYGVGGKIQNLKLGVVNHEITSLGECFNKSLMTTEIKVFQCSLHKVSCMFITEFDVDVAELVRKPVKFKMNNFELPKIISFGLQTLSQ